MPLSAEARSQLIALLPELGPDGDRSAFVDAARAMGADALEEVGELPGLESIRAGLIRVLPELVDDDDALEALFKAADEALAVYPAMAREDDPMLTLARHPAWVGLAAMELAAHIGEPQDGLDRAVLLATVGFEGSGGTAPGEVLWAIAEQADDVGWTGRASELLQAAHTARFDDEGNRGEVRLLIALRMAEDGDPLALDLLQAVMDAPGGSQRRVHAAWVIAALVQEAQPARAIEVLSLALALLNADEDADEEVIERVRSTLVGLGGKTDATA